MGRGLKRLIRLLIIFLVIVFILIGLPLILFHMKTEAPIDQYNDATENAFYQALDDNLTSLVVDSEEDTMSIRVTDTFINRVIQKQLSAGNDKYQVATYEGELAYDYMVFVQDIVGVKGVWTTLTDDALTLTAGADILINGTVFYQTGLEMRFNIVLSENDQYFLQIDKIQIGNINLPKKQAFALTSSIVNMLTSKSLNDMIAEQLSFGTFEEEELSLVIGEVGLTEYLYTIDPTLSALLKLIYRESLLVLDISNGGFDIQLSMNALRRLITDLDAPSFTKWDSESDKVAFMADFALQAVTNALLNPLDPYIDLEEADINAILDYTLGEDVQFELPIEFMLNGVQKEYSFASTNLFLRLNDDELSAHLKMSLTKTDLVGSFDMQFNLNTNVSMNANGDIVLTVIDSNLGTIDIDNETLTALIGTLDPNLMVGDTLVIPEEKVNEMFEGSNIVINDSYVNGGLLRLHYGLAG